MRKALVLFLAAFAIAAAASAGDLDALRDAYAKHYFDPAAHMALVKELHDRGELLTAFFVCESARRERFDEETFNAAFAKAFHTHEEKRDATTAAVEGAHPDDREVLTSKIDALLESDPAAAKPLVAAALEKYPNDGWLHFDAGRVAQKAGDERGAAFEYRQAAKLAPDNATVQGWTARYLYKVMNDPQQALVFYLNAYFLDPHFYETEYAESRIRRIATDLARGRLSGLDAAALIPSLRDRDPVVAGAALEALDGAWFPGAAQPVAALLRHDDPGLRASAADLLARKTGPEFDELLTKLLADDDARVRGSDAYIAVERWHHKGIEAIRSWLDSPYELIRYDTLSALLLHGGDEGKAIVKAYAKSRKEKSAALREMLTRATSGTRP